ncbi:MAG TPA: TRAP transporter substrate-binding protein DctP [Candidatus Eisenbacteria bacterium]|jgi:TRAP-type C4-dicarboxylate transport system substrate-binding protein
MRGQTRRSRFTLPLLLTLLLAAAIAAGPRAAHAQVTVVKLATLVPEGSVWDKALRDMGAEWSSSTQGRVSLRVYPGGVAGDEPDVVRKMRIGQLQAAAVTTAGLASIDPSFNVFNVPMFFTSYPELYATLDKLEPLLKSRLEAKGFVLLSWGHGGWVYFFTKAPVATVEGLRKSKMFTWTGDDQMVSVWKAKGFNPVPLAATDIMTALQTGMIEAYPTTPLLGLTLQWYRMTPNMVGMGMAPLVGGLVMSKSAWLKLPEADRARVQSACDRMEKRLEIDVPRQDTTAVAEMQKRGLHVNAVSSANAAEFRSVAEEFATAMAGIRIPPDVLALARKERDAFRARAGVH